MALRRGDLAGLGKKRGKKGRLPGFGYFDGEVPGVGGAGLVAAKFAGGFFHGAV